MDRETVELVLANRAFLYGLVARAFAEEPDESFVQILLSDHIRDEILLVDDEFSATLASCLESMAGSVAAEGVPGLRAEYVRLFVGPGTLPCSPWETMHTTGKRVLFQAGVLDVRDAYRAAGFLPARYPAVADDFIGLECDFMARLAGDAYEAWTAGDASLAKLRLEQSLSFANDHLLTWVDKLASSLEGCGGGLYAAAARMAGLLGRRDARLVESLLA